VRGLHRLRAPGILREDYSARLRNSANAALVDVAVATDVDGGLSAAEAKDAATFDKG